MRQPMTIESVRAGMYAKMDGGEMISACGSDAMKWAEAFMELNPAANVELDVMIGWFANAMMTMWDVTNSNATHSDEALCDHISALVRNRDLWRELADDATPAGLQALQENRGG
jgi:hypothetical protein